MKKNYLPIKAFIILLCIMTVKLGAQLSGTVTINSANATGGTNYQTFTDLATALNTSGVSGPLTVDVASGSGPYNEQPSFNAITGASSTNTITVNGNGCTLSFNSTALATPWTLNLNGADYMNFNNLIMVGLGTNYAIVCLMSNGADYNTFTACTFSCNANGTSSYQNPVRYNGTNSGSTSYNNSGSYNTFTGCTLNNGYYSIYQIGLTGAPYQTGNKYINNLIRDFYSMACYIYYAKNTTFKGNICEQPTRTSLTTVYLGYFYYGQGALVEGNRYQDIFSTTPTTGNSCYGIYMYWNSANGGKVNPNIIRNNIISDISGNGLNYGLQLMYIDGYVQHNTISLDYTGSTSGSTTYGIYSYAQSGYEIEFKNNIVSITRGGGGTKYGLYFAIANGVSGDYNDIYVASLGGTNYYGYYNGNQSTKANFNTAAGFEVNSFTIDPVFTNIATNNYIPTSTSLNNQGTPVGVVQDIDLYPRSSANPDIGAHEFLSIACAGTPSANTVLTPTYAICSGQDVGITLGTYFSDLGITYQWRSSTTSSVGPFTNITGATGPLYTAPNVTVNTWYSPVITCTNGGGNTSPVGMVLVAGTTTNTVPYFESFEGIGKTDMLPNCSWTSPQIGTTVKTYTASNTLGRTPRTGSKFSSFYYTPNGERHVYTNGIWMEPGITYSASLWFQTEYYGYNNWSDLSILIGTSQSTTGLVQIASTNGPAISNIYKSLSNTFTVSAAGLYYVAIRATAVSGSAQYLSWDDLAIEIPCSLNSPTMNVSATNTTVCQGQGVNITALGADSYAWSTGDNGSAIVATLNNVGLNNVTVVGSNTLSGCSTTLTQVINVNPSPNINVFASSPAVCAGQPINLTAFGASTFTWSIGGNSPVITVMPTSNTTYTVLGSNVYGCTGVRVYTVNVNPLPTVSGAADRQSICVGESVTLTGSGAANYQWVSSNQFIQLGNPIVASPNATGSYTVTGTDMNGCTSSGVVSLNVDLCSGIVNNNLNNNVFVYPNPTSGALTVEVNNATNKTIEVTDLTGRIVASVTSTEEKININLDHVSNGIYHLNIRTGTSVEVIKIVKN